MNMVPPNQKQQPSVYTVMLALSVVFLLIAVIAMWVERGRYAPDFSNTSAARVSGMIVSGF